MQALKERDLTLECLVHDLNNVFQTLVDSADVLSGDPKWSSLAGTIFRSVERGKRIVESMSGSPLECHEFDAILTNSQQFVEDFLNTIHGVPIRFARNVDPALCIRGKAAAWERVLVNLFLNAAQAMAGGGLVEVTAHEEDGCISIEVADEGTGIPPSILPEIFKPRFSTKSARGLGLHIVATIVKEYGGVVTAANREGGRGACFRIVVPAEAPLNRADN